MKRALIVAAEYSVGLSRLPKVLTRAGCRVTVLGPSNTLVRRSRYTSEFISSGSNRSDVTVALQDHLQTAQPYDLVLLGDDDALMAMANRWNETWVGDWLPFPKSAAAAAIATNKIAFGEAMLAAGAPYPRSVRVNSLLTASQAAESLGYPVVLKAGHGSMGVSVRILKSAGELEQAFSELKNGDLQVQKYISGRVGCTASFFDHGRLLAFAPSFKCECFPDTTGPSCVREFVTHPDMEKICTVIGEVTGYHGFAGVDWILDESGKLHVIEFNARPIPGYHFCDAAGVDFSLALKSMLAGERPPIAQPYGGAKVYMFPQHLLRCRYERDWLSLLRYLPLCGLMDLPWDDYRLLLEPILKKLPDVFSSSVQSRDLPAVQQSAALGSRS